MLFTNKIFFSDLNFRILNGKIEILIFVFEIVTLNINANLKGR